MSDHFITEFGHRIDFVPGYYEANRFYADLALARWGNKRAYESESEAPPIATYMLAKDWALFSALMAFLDKHGLSRRWERGIDLGGAEGTVIRLFKAAGLIKHSTNLDIIDFTKQAPDSLFTEFVARIRDKTYFGPTAMKELLWAKRHLDYAGDLVEALPEAPTLSENLVMSAVDVAGKYDLVIANALLEFVDLDLMLPKIRSILNKGGLLVGSFNAAWCPVVPSGLLGDFPYLFQRLTLNDAQRYFSEHHTDQLQNLESRYNWFHEGKYRPTLTDWLALFQLYGLRVLAVQRVSAPVQRRYQHAAPQLMKEPWFNMLDVLRDAHYINDSVAPDDLMTTAYRMAVTLR